MQSEQIIKIEYLGEQQTYDIEIDHPSHIFYGNGIATSNSHSVSYSYNSYLSAYCKANYPEEFYTAYLKFAHEKIKPQREIYELVNDAKSVGIYIQPPNIKRMNPTFDLDITKNKSIYFGLCDVKNVGQSVIDKLHKTIEKAETLANKRFQDFSWLEFLILVAPEIKSNSIESLISVGACDSFNITRSKMLFELNIIGELSKKELDWIKDNQLYKLDCLIKTIDKMIDGGVGRNLACANKNRLEKIKDLKRAINFPPKPLEDMPHIVCKDEHELLGISLTATSLDECISKFKANCTCLEYNNGFGKGRNKQQIVIAANIDLINKTTIKNGDNKGKEMAFLEASDDTGILNSIVVFNKCFEEYKYMIAEGNKVLLCGYRQKDKDSFIVDFVEQL